MDNFRRRYPGFLVYPRSVNRRGGGYFFLASRNGEKFIVAGRDNFTFFPAVQNAGMLLKKFPFLKARPCGLENSFGFGDRLGMAAPGHIRALGKHGFFPLLAQQSARELHRTSRSFKEVMDAAVLGCFQEGYKGGFGADADHIKELHRLREAVSAGFTFFTIDPSEKVYNPSSLPSERKKKMLSSYLAGSKKLFSGRKYYVGKNSYEFNEEIISDLILTYAESIDYVEECYKFLKSSSPVFDFEVSYDETSLPTTPLAHIFIVEMLKRKNVQFQSLALRFPGRFEKGIDYIGDTGVLEEALEVHGNIRQKTGDYKLSLHSGSDKFTVYPYFKKIPGGKIHVKTAGTSWIEAVKVIAEKDFSFFLRMLECSAANFVKNSASYEISARPGAARRKALKSRNVEDLFNDANVRQVIHISYGTILTEKDLSGRFRYRDRFFEILAENEELYHARLENHLGKHLRLLQ